MNAAAAGQRPVVGRRLFLRTLTAGSVAAGLAAAGCAAHTPPGPPALVEKLPPSAGSAPAESTPGALSHLPGIRTEFAGMAARAVADLVALDGPFPNVPDPTGRWTTSAGMAGAAIAGWAPPWRYVWPRDASFVVAALTAAGQPARAGAVLDFLAAVAPADGRWQARYLPDRSGRIPDERGVQADSGGWVCWAVWSHLTARPVSGRPGVDLARWWPMVAASAWIHRALWGGERRVNVVDAL